MGVPSRHILSQGAVLSSLGRTAFLAWKQRRIPSGDGAALAAPPQLPPLPGPEVALTRPPLPRDLIDDYVRLLGGDPRAYRGEVPPHLFPQWCLPALARTLEGLPYPLLRVVNGGCRVQVNGRLADSEPISVRARLLEVDDDGKRAVLHQQVLTGTRSVPEALAIDFYAIVPLARGKKDPTAPIEKREPRTLARVPEGAREIARERLRHDFGLSFAKLTGDFNPIHWVAPYARASGFPDVILHGFGTLGLCWEALNRGLFGGDVHALSTFDVKLTRPLVLPHEVGIYVDAHQTGSAAFVGDAPGGPAYLTGQFSAGGKS